VNEDGVDGAPIVIGNEFVDVEVRRVHTRNGVRLEIHSPRRGTTVRLDAMVLDALTWQPPEVFSDLLRSETDDRRRPETGRG
jgi:hypothetical protein